jgi:hypothetical protein
LRDFPHVRNLISDRRDVGNRDLETLLSIGCINQLGLDVLPDFVSKQQRWKLTKVQIVHHRERV